ncbi:hypothetical protein BH23GEM9_BH23GEM9_20030 [soil metagenome]
MSVREHHERAMSLAEQMLAARHRGHRNVADKLAIEAFEAELRAATLAFDKEVSDATRLILLRSTANLAREARQWEPGMELIIRALSAEELRPYRTEVFRIMETLRTYEHLSISGVTLSDTDVQLTIAGPDAAPDFARSDEVLNRVQTLQKLMIRNAMRRAGIPYAEGTPRAHRFRSVFTPYISQARAASFAVTLRFGIDEQQELALFEDMGHPSKSGKPPGVSKVLEDVVRTARAYSEGGPEGLRRVIEDESYARNAAGLLRELSPDSRRIETVGFTTVRNGKPSSVALPERNAFEASKMPWFGEGGTAEALPAVQRTVTGQLLAGDAVRADRARGTIVEDDGSMVKFRYDEASHGDVIDGYWKHRVTVLLRRLKTDYLLLSIDDA